MCGLNRGSNPTVTWPFVLGKGEGGRGGRLEFDGNVSTGDRSRVASAVDGLGSGLICKGGRRVVVIFDLFGSASDVGRGGVDDTDWDV